MIATIQHSRNTICNKQLQNTAGPVKLN